MSKAIKIKVSNEKMIAKIRDCLIFWDDECPFCECEEIYCANEHIESDSRDAQWDNCVKCMDKNVKFKVVKEEK